MKDKLLSIGEVSKLSGVHIKSLRYYEKIGVLKPHYINEISGYRYYSFNQIYFLEIIKFSVEMDLPLKELAVFFDNEGTIDLLLFFEHIKSIVDKKIKSLQKGLNFVNFFEMNINLGDKYPFYEIYHRDIKDRYFFIKPLTKRFEDISDMDMADIFMNMPYTDGDYYEHLEYGFMIKKSKAVVERYAFIDVPKERSNMMIPAKNIPCLQTKELAIENVEEIFGEFLDDSGEFIAMSTELYSRKFNINESAFELRLVY